jgi:hypothetical protein
VNTEKIKQHVDKKFYEHENLFGCLMLVVVAAICIFVGIGFVIIHQEIVEVMNRLPPPAKEINK